MSHLVRHLRLSCGHKRIITSSVVDLPLSGKESNPNMSYVKASWNWNSVQTKIFPIYHNIPSHHKNSAQSGADLKYSNFFDAQYQKGNCCTMVKKQTKQGQWQVSLHPHVSLDYLLLSKQWSSYRVWRSEGSIGTDLIGLLSNYKIILLWKIHFWIMSLNQLFLIHRVPEKCYSWPQTPLHFSMSCVIGSCYPYSTVWCPVSS